MASFLFAVLLFALVVTLYAILWDVEDYPDASDLWGDIDEEGRL